MKKNRIFTVAVVLSVLLCWPICWSIGNPGISNPIGSSTVPPSTFSSGLFSNPSPIDTSGNLLITGNVRRGRHFRGDVPYRSATSFSSSLGSSSLSSFLRDTAGSEDLRTYYNQYGTQPYYSPTETVTTMIPGRSEIFMPTSTMMNTNIQQNARTAGAIISDLEFRPKEQSLFGRRATASDSDLQRPITQYGPLAQSRLMLESEFPTNMSLNSQDVERLEPTRVGIRQQDQAPSFELFKEQIQNISDRAQDSMMVSSNKSPVNLSDNNISFQYPVRETKIGDVTPNYEPHKFPSNITDDEKQAASNPYKCPDLKGLKSSMDTKTQDNLFLHKDKYSSVTADQFLTTQEQNGAGALGTFKAGGSDASVKFRIGQDIEQGDVLERIRQQLDDLTKALNATTQSDDAYNKVSTEQTVKREEVPLGHQRKVPDSRQLVPREQINSSGKVISYQQRRAEISFEGEEPTPTTKVELNQIDGNRQSGLEFTGISNYTDSQKRSYPLQELNALSQAEISAEANRIMGHHRSLESLSGAKFNQHMDEAEGHLKAGRYYRAAGCFSLASVYQPGNPMALAGRGHALFAAGEYVSSALFLSRALAISPEYLLVRVDIVAMLGDENKLASRIADIEQWLARSGSSQLQFLLGYIYYRTGQLLKAKQVIDAAYEKTPESPAVQVMKITIDNMMIRQ